MEALTAPPYFVSCRSLTSVPNATSRFKAYITAVTVAAVLVGAVGLALSPLWPPIGGPVGLAFLGRIVALGTSNSVRMPGGTIVDVGIAPLWRAPFSGARRGRRCCR